MKVPINIALKLARYEEVKKEEKILYSQIIKWLNSNANTSEVHIGDIFITDEPKGVNKVGCKYHYQICLPNSGKFLGVYYYPIENSDKYLAYSYKC